MYEEKINEYDVVVVVRTNEDGSVTWIPSDEDNIDYQAYLAWKAEN